MQLIKTLRIILLLAVSSSARTVDVLCIQLAHVEAAFSTAGVDFSDTSAFTQDQWPIICSQLKPVLRQKDAADSAKNCSSRLGNMYEAAQTMCPIAGAASNNPANNANDAVSKAMRTAMCQGFKAMEAALRANGVDVSDPSKLTDGQWIMVCSQAKLVNAKLVPTLKGCSPKLGTLFDVSKTKCGTQGTNDGLAQQQQAKAREAVCQVVKTMETGLTLAGEDLSDPSKLTNVQWAMICGQMQVYSKTMQKQFAACSKKMTTVFSASTNECDRGALLKKRKEKPTKTELKKSATKYWLVKCHSIKALETGLIAVGVDVSHPEKLTNAEWRFLCSYLPAFDVQTTAMFPLCSKKFENLNNAKKNQCPKITAKPGSSNSHHQPGNAEKINAAGCQAVKAIEKGLVVGGIDISDPSKIPKIEWKAICAQLLILNFQQQAVVAKCSTKVANLLEASKSKCQVGGDSEPDVCKQLEQVFTQTKASGVDLSDPSTFKGQLSFVCGQLAVTNEESGIIALQLCSSEMARVVIDAKRKCVTAANDPNGLPGTGSDDYNNCNSVNKMMSATLVTAGVDLSDLSKFTQAEWRSLCRQLHFFSVKQWSTLRRCSEEFRKLLEASNTKCTSNNGESNDDLDEAACQAVTAMETAIAAAGVDSSDASHFSSLQWAVVCAQVQIFPKKFKPFVTHCSEETGKMFGIAKQECPTFGFGGENDPDDAKSANAVCQMVSTLEFSLDAAGIDISHPSQLKKHEWGLVCAQLTVFSVEMLPMLTIKTCSHKIFKLLKASDGKCETPSSDNNGGEAHYALCRSVATIESGLSVAGVDISNPYTLTDVQWGVVCNQLLAVTEKQRRTVSRCSRDFAKLLFASNVKCSATATQNSCKMAQQMLIMIKASGIDLSDPNSIGGPSGLSGPQLIFFCARFGTKNAKEIASFRKCSLELADLLTVGNQVCRDGGRAGSAAGPEECKNPKEPSNKNCKRQKRGQVRGVCGAQLLRDCVDLKQGNCDDDKISLETCQHINVLKTGGPGSNKCYGRVEAVCAKQNLAAYQLVGAGWCLVSASKLSGDYSNHPPALSKRGAKLPELKQICNILPGCIALGWGNTASGHLFFISVSAINAVAVPDGYTKWTKGCQTDCRVTTSAVMGPSIGECWLKNFGIVIIGDSTGANVLDSPSGQTTTDGPDDHITDGANDAAGRTNDGTSGHSTDGANDGAGSSNDGTSGHSTDGGNDATGSSNDGTRGHSTDGGNDGAGSSNDGTRGHSTDGGNDAARSSNDGTGGHSTDGGNDAADSSNDGTGGHSTNGGNDGADRTNDGTSGHSTDEGNDGTDSGNNGAGGHSTDSADGTKGSAGFNTPCGAGSGTNTRESAKCSEPILVSKETCKKENSVKIRGICGAQLVADCIAANMRSCDDITATVELCQHVDILKQIQQDECKCHDNMYTTCQQQKNDDYRLFAKGQCRVAFGKWQQNYLPMLSKRGAKLPELQQICDILPGCIALDWGNTASGHLFFISVSAMNAVAVPDGYTKWTKGCQADCRVRTSAIMGQSIGECWLKNFDIPKGVKIESAASQVDSTPDTDLTPVGVAVGVCVVLVLVGGIVGAVVVVIRKIQKKSYERAVVLTDDTGISSAACKDDEDYDDDDDDDDDDATSLLPLACKEDDDDDYDNDDDDTTSLLSSTV